MRVWFKSLRSDCPGNKHFPNMIDPLCHVGSKFQTSEVLFCIPKNEAAGFNTVKSKFWLRHILFKHLPFSLTMPFSSTVICSASSERLSSIGRPRNVSDSLLLRRLKDIPQDDGRRCLSTGLPHNHTPLQIH